MCYVNKVSEGIASHRYIRCRLRTSFQGLFKFGRMLNLKSVDLN